MATAKGEVTVHGAFVGGKDVEVHDWQGDQFDARAAGPPAKRVRVDRSGDVTVRALVPGRVYWLVQEGPDGRRVRRVVPQVPVPADPRPPQREIDRALKATLTPESAQGGTVVDVHGRTVEATGAARAEFIRETAAIPGAHDATARAGLGGGKAKAADAPRGAAQRSATPSGEATVFDPAEPSPPVTTESAAGREERLALEAQAAAAKAKRRRRAAKAKTPAKAKKAPTKKPARKRSAKRGR